MTQTSAGVDQPDCASVQIGSVYYRAHSYRVAQYIGTGVIGGVQIRVRVFIEQPNAQQVEVFDTVVADTDGDIGIILDCPKMICVGTTLVVCWLQFEDAVIDLHMSTLNLDLLQSAGTAWTDHGSIPTHSSGLYDLINIETDEYFSTHATDFIIVHRTDADEYAVNRHNGFDFISFDWVETFTTPANIADSILAAHAFETILEPTVLVTYQTDTGGDNSAGVVRTTRFNSTNGVQTADVRSFFGIPAAVRATQATHRRVLPDRVVLAIEYVSDDDLNNGNVYVRWIAGVVLVATTLAQDSGEMAVANLHMVSRAFGVPGMSAMVAPSQRVFLGVAFKNMGTTTIYDAGVPVLGESGSEWAQALGMIIDLDWQRWEDDLTARPFVVAQMPHTVFDARVSGRTAFLADAIGATTVDARRTNLLSHAVAPPDFGPSIKSMTFAHVAFARAQNVGISTSSVAVNGIRLVPVAAMIRGWEFNYEDPWISWRDGRNEPSENWSGIHELAQSMALPVGRHTIFGGSSPIIYDGVQAVELGFPWVPEIVVARGDLEPQPAGLVGGEYYYVAHYEWTDPFGAVHRSGPSAPVLITLDDPGSDRNWVTLTIRTMTVSLRDNHVIYQHAHDIAIVIYRTVANGTQLYRLNCLDNAFGSDYSIDHTPLNEPRNWAITFVDRVPDETLLTVNDPIPWPMLSAALDASGFPIPLEPQQVPPGSVMAVWQEHLFVASMERPDEVRFSLRLRRSNIDYDIAPEFNDVNVVTRSNMGPVTGMAAMDQQLIVFTPDAIYSMQGRIPDDTGSDGDLQIYTLAVGIGCICPRSVVVTAGDGVFFQSRKGYYQLDRGGNTSYVGADVEDYINDSGMVLSATVKESKHHLRLVVNTAAQGAVVLHYDTLAKLWSRALPPQFVEGDGRGRAAHGLMWRGLDGEVSHILLQQGGSGYERAASDTPYGDRDDGTIDIAIPIDVQTSWIHVADIGGVQRIRSILLTLSRPAQSQITVTLEYSIYGGYSADVTQTIVFEADDDVPLRCRPSQQKCTAFRIRITETGSVPTTENLSITAITLIAGVKHGHSKLPVERTG